MWSVCQTQKEDQGDGWQGWLGIGDATYPSALSLRRPQLKSRLYFPRGCPWGDLSRSHRHRAEQGEPQLTERGCPLRCMVTGGHLARPRLQGQAHGRGPPFTLLLYRLPKHVELTASTSDSLFFSHV